MLRDVESLSWDELLVWLQDFQFETADVGKTFKYGFTLRFAVGVKVDELWKVSSHVALENSGNEKTPSKNKYKIWFIHRTIPGSVKYEGYTWLYQHIVRPVVNL